MRNGEIAALLFMALGYGMGSVLFGHILPRYFKGMDIEAVSEDPHGDPVSDSGYRQGMAACYVGRKGAGSGESLVCRCYGGSGDRPCFPCLEERSWRKGHCRQLRRTSGNPALQQKRVAFDVPVYFLFVGGCDSPQ